MKLVSIIIPVYNVELYLKDCLESVLNQTYKNIEILLIDDGSTDLSGSICDEYAKYQNIKVFHKENGGLSSARNYGIEQAKGDYISFIDSDDSIDEEFVERLLALLEKNKSRIAMCRFTRKENELGKGNYNTYLIDAEKVLKNILYQKDDLLFSVAACNKLYDKEVFSSLRYPIGKQNEDMYVICELLKDEKNITVCDYSGYYYRINYSSITQQSFSKKSMDAVYACEYIMDYIKLNYQNSELYKAAKNITFRRNFQMLKKLWSSINWNEDNEIYEKILLKNINILKKDILFDKESKLSSKLAAILFFLNINLVKKLIKLAK